MSGDTIKNLVSVIIPAFNAEAYIPLTLASVAQQTHSEIEIIVVDDGSTDNTIALIKAAAAKDPRIVLLESRHRGVSHARNLGIARARGTYIAPIDADDLWTRDKLAKQLAVLKSAPARTGVVYCWAAGIDDSEHVVIPVWNASVASGDVLCNIIESGILSCGSTPLVRKDLAIAIGGYDENLDLAEDWKFYTALAGICSFEVIPECLTGYRIRSDSASMNLEAMEKALVDFTNWVVSRWPDLPKSVLQKREFSIATYLSFMAIRASQYRRVPRYCFRALAAKPGEILGLRFWQFPAAAVAHALGLRRYEWAFWRKPTKFVQ